MRLERLDLNLLVVLESLLETHSVSQTALELNVSQPTISAALKRLRDYFGDDLLISSGRTMIPTPKGNDLSDVVTELLNQARFRIVRSELFDPPSSSRQFRIIASDYVFDILLAKTLSNIHQIAPNVTFEILPIAPDMVSQFQTGKVDLMITLNNFIIEGHPSRKIFTDDDVVISWNSGDFMHGVTAEQFSEAAFVDAVFGAERRSALSELNFNAMGLKRNISVQVSTFSALPATVVGTNRLAVMHRKHAEFFKLLYPISLHELPVTSYEVCQIVQWHRLRENDTGIHWLLGQLDLVADTLAK